MSLAVALENASDEFRVAQKELEKLIQAKQQFLTQKHENDMVLQELKLLGDDAQVFKLVGPAMIKKDTKDSITNVQTRLDLITRELERIEKREGDVQTKAREAKEKLGQLQQVAEAQKNQRKQ